MSRTVRSPRRVLVPVVMAAVLALSGCAAGQISQTADQVAAVDGANATIGYISVLNVVLAATSNTAYPKGADAPLQLWLSNTGIQPDQLTGISSAAATSVQINGIKAIPGQTLKDLTGPKGAITLKGLTKTVPYGHSIPVTFTFATAGSLTVNVPIAIPSERTPGRPDINIQEPEQSSLYQPNGEGAGTGG